MSESSVFEELKRNLAMMEKKVAEGAFFFKENALKMCLIFIMPFAESSDPVPELSKYIGWMEYVKVILMQS